MFARDGARGDESRKPPPPPLMEKKLGRAGGVAREHEVPFDFARDDSAFFSGTVKRVLI
jgi:hypothetical protein